VQVILLACYGFIVGLLLADRAWRGAGSSALLIPYGWLLIQGSRPLSYWFGGGGGGEAHPVNTIWYALILFASLAILAKRQLMWSAVVAQNKALFAIYFYLFLSVFWSEDPIDSLKRIIKDFEAILVALVLLSEKDPAASLRMVFVRVAYILFPLSFVFIKYFPNIGRNATRAGENMFTGVTTQKNSLGLMVFVLVLVIVWDLIQTADSEHRSGKRLQILIRVGMLGMGLWLLKTCDSQTSFLCLFLGGVLIWVCGRLAKMKNGRRLLVVSLIGVTLMIVGDKYLGLSSALLDTMGRDSTLTGRTDIWKAVLAQPIDVVFGNGYWVFWYSDKGTAVIEELLLINSAHNGYLETYLDGGILGILLLVVLLLTMGTRTIGRLFNGHALGVLGVTFWLVAIPYNWSESSFFRMDILWFSLLLLTIEAAFPTKAGSAANIQSSSVILKYEYARG